METIETKEDFHEEDTDKLPLYDGAQISLGESVLMMMGFVRKHNLTGEAFSDLLELIHLHCKEVNLLPDSVYRLKKWFHHLNITPKKHFYCGKCLVYISQNCDKCPNSKCGKTFQGKKDKSFFVEVSLIEQLKKLFKRTDFRGILQKQFHRAKDRNLTNNITDIFDGLFYQSALKTHKFTSNDITFTWNTDGVPLFKSSKTSMWPLYLAINELPYKMRRNPENLLLVGLWIGPKKPEMLTFLQPFINDLEQLEKGIEIETPSDQSDGVDNIIFRGFLISGTADLPAKCIVHNMVQFNGKYSCPCCLQPGETAKSGRGICYVFPFDFNDPTGPKRTHHESLQLAEFAVNGGKAELGIKGPCWFTKLGAYDFVKSNCIDYMHCVLLGITKRLINLWFSKEHAGKPFNVSDKVDKVDSKIVKLQPPMTISRAPRTIAELKYWKASEYRSFLLFYGPIVLMNVLCSQYYDHFLLLSGAIFILLKDSVEHQELEQAEDFLEYFVATFTGLYEPRFLTLNFHLLLHLPGNVRQMGPLWGYSCFPFEDANGFLMKLVKGTQSVHSQLIDSIAIMHSLPHLRQNCVVSGSKVDSYIQKLTMPGSRKMKELATNVFALGGISEVSPEKISQDCYVALANFLTYPPSSMIKKFKRLKSHGTIIHSREYTRVKVRNTYTVKYKNVNGTIGHGLINYFIAYHENVLAIISELCPSYAGKFHFPFCDITDCYLMSHFSVFDLPNFQSEKVAVPVSSIEQVCIYIAEGKNAYVCSLSNSVEKD
ncbi:uncharacterized protein [Argopecten irradians]|uniref:uncharacterized protein n=1 Tax=Argopecten irradians TaxID=31199 RepID=UPI00371F0A3B